MFVLMLNISPDALILLGVCAMLTAVGASLCWALVQVNKSRRSGGMRK